MIPRQFKAYDKSSISLCSMVARHRDRLPLSPAAMAHGVTIGTAAHSPDAQQADILVEGKDITKLVDWAVTQHDAPAVALTGTMASIRASTRMLGELLDNPSVDRIHAKKKSKLHLTRVLPSTGLLRGKKRQVVETGKGTLIGVIDSGFDLGHPMFHDSSGKLRVARLLDQADGKEYSGADLERLWKSGKKPGGDDHGHGTHVASIAGGSSFHGYEGVAPDARFLLVRTDFVNTPDAVSWVFKQAGTTPCVINMSLGHHLGAHDGTDPEERLHRDLTSGQSGRVIVVSAGNERTDPIHIGGHFHTQQSEGVGFRVLPQQDSLPYAVLTLWYSDQDAFDVSVSSPTGQLMKVPAVGNGKTYDTPAVSVELAARRYSWSHAIEVKVSIGFKRVVRERDLVGWSIGLLCKKAVVGRIDGWFNNSGFGEFSTHPLVEDHRTVGLPSTGDGCITIASFISRSTWDADDGAQRDHKAVVGRSSPFSSLGPTRDGRQKPEIAAAGQYVTAALADRSGMAEMTDRTIAKQKLLTIEGTSMAAPVITGVVALMLQKKPTATLAEIRAALVQSTRRDVFTGSSSQWNPAYGFGKVSVVDALDRL